MSLTCQHRLGLVIQPWCVEMYRWSRPSVAKALKTVQVSGATKTQLLEDLDSGARAHGKSVAHHPLHLLMVHPGRQCLQCMASEPRLGIHKCTVFHSNAHVFLSPPVWNTHACSANACSPNSRFRSSDADRECASLCCVSVPISRSEADSPLLLE